MTKPTKATIYKAREDIIKALALVRSTLPSDMAAIEAWAQVETFCAISLRVMAKTNMSKLRSETSTVELSARLAGRVVFDPD